MTTKSSKQRCCNWKGVRERVGNLIQFFKLWNLQINEENSRFLYNLIWSGSISFEFICGMNKNEFNFWKQCFKILEICLLSCLFSICKKPVHPLSNQPLNHPQSLNFSLPCFFNGIELVLFLHNFNSISNHEIAFLWWIKQKLWTQFSSFPFFTSFCRCFYKFHWFE